MTRFVSIHVLVALAVLIACPVAFAESFEDEGEAFGGENTMQRFRISVLTGGATFLLDNSKRVGALPMGPGGDLSFELGICPSISAMLSFRVNYFWQYIMAPVRLGVKIRFPSQLDSSLWFEVSGAPRIKGSVPYVKLFGGLAYSGVFGDPSSKGWFLHSEERDLYTFGAAGGVEVRIAGNAQIFIEVDLSSVVAEKELPSVFLGFMSGVSLSF